MTASASTMIRTSVAGASVSQRIDRTEEIESYVSVPLPAGKAGTLTARGSSSAGTATLATGHGITSGTMCIFWDGGSRYGVSGTTSGATDITFTGGAGTDLPDTLPAVATPIVVTKEVSSSVDIDGAKVVDMAVKSARRSSVQFKTVTPTSIARFDMPDGEGRFFISNIGMTNFLGSSVVASIAAANGTTQDTTLEIGLLMNAPT